jgi:hypothetical protein
MANVGAQSEPEVPHQFPNITPDVSLGSGHIRLVVSAVENTVAELKGDVKELKSHRHTDFVFMISIFSAGFVLLAGMIIGGYLLTSSKIDALSGKIESVEVLSARIETKLDDLLLRIPPVVAPVPKK